MKGRVLTFYLCDCLYGLDISKVKEISRHADFTPVPDAPEHIAGLLNMRGKIVTLFDLAKLLGHPPADGIRRTACIILKNTEDEPDYAGLLIDRPDSVIDIEEAFCERPQDHLENHSGCIREVVKLKDRLLMIIDPGCIYQAG
ncbi:chemotaxis protein CheW [Paenibacillus hamazuiensis]|uniref:chemotaxis protein CheW n=1 Tax=Paenibacillus hamazuiensis TaxID=2936508 RepID=UPI00201049C3|nr:chemotaxis protein CheW [Paenibacillus hamazuiensis]